MKVYLVTQGSYSDYYVDKIFSSKEKADMYIALHSNDKWAEFNPVEEFEVDSAKIEGDIKVTYEYRFFFERPWSFKKGALEDEFRKSGFWLMAVKAENENLRSFVTECKQGNTVSGLDITVFLPSDDKEDVALKIAQDMIAEWKARKEDV